MEDRPAPEWAESLLEWLRGRLDRRPATSAPSPGSAPRQGLLWCTVAYQEEAPRICSLAEFDGAIEHLEYAVFRRYENNLTRAERGRLDNTIRNVMFKLDRYLERLEAADRQALESRYRAVQEAVREARDGHERMRQQARRAEHKLSQLGSLTPEGFEEFVAELFEALAYEVDRVGGTGDDGADLMLRRHGQIAVAQCKYHRSQGVIGSPELRRFLGTIHHMHAHKGYFVTTRTFSLSAERFAADHPIELVDGPRLVELVEEALGPVARRAREAAEPWF